MNQWLVLSATLPTSPSALRVRIWRALKATQCAMLREGVYLLPAFAPAAAQFRALDAAICESGAQSHLLELTARDDAQQAGFCELFDRADLHAEFAQSLKEARKAFKSASEADIRKSLRALEQQLQSLLEADFFPGKGLQQSTEGLRALRLEAERKLSPGEPEAGQGEVPKRNIADYQARTWATRARPWVDRLASAWLIARFIDKQPTFLWFTQAAKCPKSTLGFDFDGATFTHVGERVTFELLAASFALDQDLAIVRLGELVHCIDAGGIAVDEAAGLELLMRGLTVQHAKDDDLMHAANAIFDALYAAMQPAP
jgi:hypothetical protein